MINNEYTFYYSNDDIESIYTKIRLLDNGVVESSFGKIYRNRSIIPNNEENMYRFLGDLDIIARKYPEIYKIVYEHIQNKEEKEYIEIADYCKSKHNDFVRQFRIIK